MEDYIEKTPHSQVKSRKKHFEGFLDKFCLYKVSEVSGSDLQEWMEGVKKSSNLSSLTMNRIKAQLNGFFKYLKSEKYLFHNPMDDVHFKQFDIPRRKRVVLSVEEVQTILKNAKKFSPNMLYPYLSCVAHGGKTRGSYEA